MSDLDNAYLAIYTFELLWHPRGPWAELEYSLQHFGQLGLVPLRGDALPPNARLRLERVRIESPGFWEIVGSLNPLQQLRQYLEDRHRRRQDREYREAAESRASDLDSDAKALDNEAKELANLRERIAILRDMGYDEEFIRLWLWNSRDRYLTRLGRHQDNGLIGGAE